MPDSTAKKPHVYIVGSDGFSFINFRLSFVEDLQKKGYAVSAVLFNASEDELTTIGAVCERVFSLSTTSYSTNVFDLIRQALRLRKILRNDGPDLVFSYFAKPNIMTLLACLGLSSIKKVSLVEGLGMLFHPQTRRLKFRVIKKLYLGILRTSDRLVVLNPDDQELLGRYFKNGMIDLVDGIGVDLDKFVYSKPRERHPESPTFIMVARLLRSKGVEEYYNAAQALKAQHPEYRFLLLGGESESSDGVSKEIITALKKGDVVNWLGHVEPLPHLKHADVFVLPSFYMEGMPRSILEAMAVGLPIVTTDWRGCRETVVEGVNGHLVEVQNVEALTKAMASIAASPEQLQSMGEASRRIAEDRFSEKAINTRLQVLIEDVLKGHKTGLDSAGPL